MFNLLLRGSEHLNCAEMDHVGSEALVLSEAFTGTLKKHIKDVRFHNSGAESRQNNNLIYSKCPHKPFVFGKNRVLDKSLDGYDHMHSGATCTIISAFSGVQCAAV